MMYEPYLMNKETGELMTYGDASKEFYSVPRTYMESVWDEWTETAMDSDIPMSRFNFTDCLNV